MNPASFFDRRPGEAEPRADLVRLVRRACVLREQGDRAGAERLIENELPRVVAELRDACGADSLPEPELQALLAREEHRVADAAVLCELLLPRLLDAWPAPAPAFTPRPPVSRVSSGAAAPAGPPAIADLLDAMLAAERPGRPSAAAPREP